MKSLSIRNLNFINPLPMSYETQLWGIYQDILKHNPDPMGGEWQRHQIEQALKSGEVVGALSSEGEFLIAFLIYVQQIKSCDLLLLGVHSAQRRNGVMSQLVRFFVKNSSCSQYFVEVHEQNISAIAFYKSLQFREVGYRKDFYGQGGSAYLLALEV